jgi:hypothetical protein
MLVTCRCVIPWITMNPLAVVEEEDDDPVVEDDDPVVEEEVDPVADDESSPTVPEMDVTVPATGARSVV